MRIEAPDWRRGLALASIVALGLGTIVGSGGGGGDPPLPPQTTATVSVPPSGGSVSIDSRVIATVAPSTLSAQGDVTVTLSPKADAEALSSSDVTISLPADKLLVSPPGEITLYFYPDGTAAGQSSTREGAMGLASSLDPRTLFAKVRVGSEKAVAFTVPVVWNAAKGWYAVSLKTTQLASAALQWTGRKIEQGVVEPLAELSLRGLDVGINLWLIKEAGEATLPRVLYRWSTLGDIIAASTPANTDKVPLILVHGIVPLDNKCSTEVFYIETWKPTGRDKQGIVRKGFADYFFGPDGETLRSKYELYTFQYPTNISVKKNGDWLARRISENFGNRPVVVVSHSMGGLVTRAADYLYSKQGLYGANARWDIDIRGVITLDTPHLGHFITHNFIYPPQVYDLTMDLSDELGCGRVCDG